ncbi:hypothetical protein DAEQUDRAFT_512685 [Daedalea quercina L-15889]|uniref:Uncharacterized protein n=1 Tax=Daedalea quercina L-15889 TaxID=1314783 RepID=A0A165MGU2_9APHY|nr:hypothetical protein DAEQUDRAFT_512685 [Daedalea quercina L-15889]
MSCHGLDGKRLAALSLGLVYEGRECAKDTFTHGSGHHKRYLEIQAVGLQGTAHCSPPGDGRSVYDHDLRTTGHQAEVTSAGTCLLHGKHMWASLPGRHAP